MRYLKAILAAAALKFLAFSLLAACTFEAVPPDLEDVDIESDLGRLAAEVEEVAAEVSELKDRFGVLITSAQDLAAQLPAPKPTATPIPAQVVEWNEAYWKVAARRGASLTGYNDLTDRIRAAGDQGNPVKYLDEYKDLRDEFFSAEGAYGFVTGGGLPRFPEVRVLNDWIAAWADGYLRHRDLYIEYLETNDSALYDRSEELRLANGAEWRAIGDAKEDFLRPYDRNTD